MGSSPRTPKKQYNNNKDMKTRTTLLWMLCFAMMLSVTSCLKDDSKNSATGLTSEEAAQYLKTVQGTYTGKNLLHYYAKNRMGVDSIAVDSTMNSRCSITASDSTLTLNVSPKLLLHILTNKDEYMEKALAKAPDCTVKVKLYPYRVSDNTSYYGFQLMPIEGMRVKYTYEDGSEHSILMAFQLSSVIENQSVASLGLYSANDRALEFFLIPYNYTIDDKTLYTATRSVFHYYATR